MEINYGDASLKNAIIEIAQLRAENEKLKSEIVELKRKLSGEEHPERKMQMRE